MVNGLVKKKTSFAMENNTSETGNASKVSFSSEIFVLKMLIIVAEP